jgi:YegS/Rv2252/BmrU family lipid kinase
MRVAVIVNPAARKGRALARWPAIQAELGKRLDPVEPMFTEAPGHATHLARNALVRSVRRIVAVGGDGTANETLNGLLDPSGRLIHPDAVLCPVPAGTANELCRALGRLATAGRAFDAAASPRSQPVDLMRVRCTGPDGRPVDRFGYLIVALGLAATISHRTSQSRWLKKLGEIAYLLMTPGVTLGYRQRDISIEIDGVPAGTRRLFTAMVGSTENGGGGMKLLPGARFDDGVLDLVEAGGMSRLEVLTNILPKLYSGAHVRHPKVRTGRGISFRFNSDVGTLVDLDGEMVGRLPLEVTVLPQAFRVGAV